MRARHAPRAMVLAAGLGTRLRPMTSVLPKPAVPIVHRPVVGYLLHALAEAGVREVVLNLHHLAEEMKAELGNGDVYGLALSWSFEEEILGTGGAVRAVEPFFDSHTSLLLNGDFLIEVDLGRVIKGHLAALAKDSRVVATMVVREDPAATKYGALGLDEGGRVVDFVGRATVPGAVVSRRGLFTGIHVLEPDLRAAIPADGAPCINKTAYPDLITGGKVVRSHLQMGHWSDIGTPGGYLQANLDVLHGRVTMAGPDPRSEAAVFVPEGEKKKIGGALIEGPSSISSSAQLGAGALIGPGVVVGHRGKVGRGAVLSRAVLWPDVVVDERAKLDGCVVWGRAGESHILEVEPTTGDPGR